MLSQQFIFGLMHYFEYIFYVNLFIYLFDSFPDNKSKCGIITLPVEKMVFGFSVHFKRDISLLFRLYFFTQICNDESKLKNLTDCE